MQIKPESSKLFTNLVKNSKNILIITGPNPSVEALVAALFLENTLSGLGNKISIYAPGKKPESFKNYREKIKDKPEVKKLVVSFNWRKNQVEKVAYNLDQDNFNFIVTPVGKKINPQEVRIFYHGEEADLIITIGVQSLAEFNDLGHDFFENKVIINVDKNKANQLFGKLNFVNEVADSVCTITAKLIEESEVPVSKNAAELLLFGLKASTDNFNSVADPTTFEVAAFCTKYKTGVPNYQKPSKPATPENFPSKTQTPNDWLTPKIFRSKDAS